ncbi:MAG: apolipoprotein N-acyltransferase, partial [Acidobacteriota bacterium]
MSNGRAPRPALAIASGVAMALAMPGPGLWPLVLLSPALLYRALEGRRGWFAFRDGWLAGFAQWVVAAAWVVIVLHRHGHLWLPLSIVALFVMAALMGLGWAVAAWGVSMVPRSWQVAVLPLALCAFEQIQHLPPWIFPWNPAAAVLTSVPALLAPAPVLGTAGLSLLVYFAGAGAGAAIDPRRRRGGAVALVAVVLTFAMASLAAPPFRPSGPPVPVAAVQPNVPLEFRWDEDNLEDIETRVMRLSAEAAGAGARWIVWPESAVPRVLERDGTWRAGLERFTREHDVWLLVGSIGLGPDEGSYSNSVFSLSPAGLLPWRYDKTHLVPFGEYLPAAVRWLLPRALVREVGSFTPGASALPLPSPAGPAGVAVCYEVAYPSLYADEVARGASVLVTITNDGWYGDSAAPRQHMALAMLRAAENRRWLVRAANTGISAVIDPEGRVSARLGLDREGTVLASVQPGSGATPAARW